MTNGEKIKATFPHYDIEIEEHKGYVRVFYKDFYITYPLRWWNAEYEEPAAKNCESCKYYGSNHKVCNYCYKCSLWTEKKPTTKNDLAHNLCDSCINYGCEFQSGIVRTKCAFYTPHIDPDNLGADYISRQEVLRLLANSIGKSNTYLQTQVLRMPSVTPHEPRCKECKWWKDSNGEYKRGCGAESKCPINSKKVYEGEGYCYMFSPKGESEK